GRQDDQAPPRILRAEQGYARITEPLLNVNSSVVCITSMECRRDELLTMDAMLHTCSSACCWRGQISAETRGSPGRSLARKPSRSTASARTRTSATSDFPARLPQRQTACENLPASKSVTART